MPVQTLSEALDNLYTTTWQNMKKAATDQIFDATPFWFWMKKSGQMESVAGGRFITEPLRYTKSERVKFIGKGGTVSLSDQEMLTVGQWEWRYLVDSIVRFGTDDQKNRGKNMIMSFMNAKLENSKDSMSDKMEETLFADNSADALAWHGLQEVIPDDPTTNNSYGGINNNTYEWWRNKTKDMTGLSFAVQGHAQMRTMLNNCGNNLASDAPDLIVSGQTPYEYYEDSVLEQKRIVNKSLGDAGFDNIQFKGRPMIWSGQAANTRMYFLTTKHLKFVYDPMMNFDMTEWKSIPDQVNDRAAQIIIAGQLVSRRRRTMGVLHTIDTP